MKSLFSFFLLMIAIPVLAQNDTVVVYYDRAGKVCSQNDAIKFALQIQENDHFKKLMVDGMDNRVEYIAYFTDAECKNFDGPYKSLYKNGGTVESGYYLKNKKAGPWRKWYDDGKLEDSFFYNDGYITGLGLSWNKEGQVVDSLIFGESGNGESHGYWSNGHPSQRGTYSLGKKNGMWTYYYRTGIKCQEVNYLADSAISFTCYDESGNLQQKDCIYEQEAAFPGGESKWLEYLSKRLGSARYPEDYYKGKIYGQVWVQFVVGIDGSLQDIKLLQSVDPSLDKIAVDIIKNSPKWNHAVQYNRPVKAYRRQPITFTQASD